jgi:hypothetical protein
MLIACRRTIAPHLAEECQPIESSISLFMRVRSSSKARASRAICRNPSSKWFRLSQSRIAALSFQSSSLIVRSAVRFASTGNEIAWISTTAVSRRSSSRANATLASKLVECFDLTSRIAILSSRSPQDTSTHGTDLRETRARSCDTPDRAWSNCANSSVIWAKTLSQSPFVSCLNNRAVGYQTVSVRCRCQRHSGVRLSAIQSGRPSAPAKCAIDVSQLITRSIIANTAAVSTKPSGPASKSGPGTSMCMSVGNLSISSLPSLSWRLTRRTPGSAASRRSASRRNDRNPSPWGYRFPRHATPTRNPWLPMLSLHLATRSASALRYGRLGNRPVETIKAPRQAHQRALKVEMDVLRNVRQQCD